MAKQEKIAVKNVTITSEMDIILAVTLSIACAKDERPKQRESEIEAETINSSI